MITEAQAVVPAPTRDPSLPDPNDWDAIEHYVVERPHLSLYKLSRELGVAWAPFYNELKKRSITEKRDGFVEQVIRDARARMANDVAEQVASGVLDFYNQVKELRKALFDSQIARARWKLRVLESWTNDADGGRPIEKRLVTERPGLGTDGKPNGTVQRVEALFRDPQEDVRLLELLAKLETELEDKLLGLRPIHGGAIPHDGGYGHSTPGKFKELKHDVEQAVRDAAMTYDARLLEIPEQVGAGSAVEAVVVEVEESAEESS